MGLSMTIGWGGSVCVESGKVWISGIIIWKGVWMELIVSEGWFSSCFGWGC